MLSPSATIRRGWNRAEIASISRVRASRPVPYPAILKGQALTDSARRRIRDGELLAKRLWGGQTVLIEQSDVLALLDDIMPGTDV